MKKLADLVAYIEGRFPSVEGLPTNRCQTGDKYVVIGIQSDRESPSHIPGTIEEGKAGEAAHSEEDAFALAKRAFDAYAEGQSGVLYWRSPATVSRETPVRGQMAWQQCRVRLRIVISAKPAIYPTIAILRSEMELERMAV